MYCRICRPFKVSASALIGHRTVGPVMPVLQYQTPLDSVASADSTVSSPFIYADNSPTGNSLRSISELLGLNMPRGTTLGQSSQSVTSNMWSPPVAASSPLPTLRHQGMRPPCFSPFTTTMDSGFSSLDTSPQPWSMPQTNSGFDQTQPFSPVTPVSAPRAIRGGSPPYSDCSSPLMEQGALQNWTSRSNSPSDSDTSNDVSSTDLSDMMNSWSLSQSGAVSSPLTEQELANLWALHTLKSAAGLRGVQTPAQTVQVPVMMSSHQRAPPPHPQNDVTEYLDKFNRYHRIQAASIFEAACTWSGVLPQRIVENPTFSCKVFLGGVPWDVTEETLICVFSQFGKVRVEWPGKERVDNQPKGYVYIIFETEKQVKALLNSCTRDISSSNTVNWYFRISSRKMKSKEVQVIPWGLNNSNFVQTPSQKLDPHTTVFVGALHGMLTAEGLFIIMNDLFGGVVYAGIDTDKFKYPIGSARVTFNNRHSYMKAIMAEFIEIKTTKFTKKVQVNPYLEDSPCSTCVVQQGPYFCRELTCFRYFCRSCWILQHQSDPFFGTHKELTRSSKTNNALSSPPQMRIAHY